MIVALPLALAAGVNVSVPLDATAGPAANSALLLLPVTSKVTVCPTSLTPGLMPVAQPATVCAPLSSRTVWSAPLVNDGASLTALISIVNVTTGETSTPPLAVPPESCARIEIVAVPENVGAGV